MTRRLPLAMCVVLLLMRPAAAAAQARPFDSPAMLSVSNIELAQGRPAGAARMRDVAAGQQIFDAQCAWCHGNGGDGGAGPNLHGRLRHATTYDSIVDIITSGIPGTDMPAFRGPLTERSIRLTATYVQSMSRSSARPAPGDTARGAALYQANSCASCHIVDGRGGILGPELTGIGGRRGPAYLRDAIVKPAAAHPPGYLVVRAVSNAGTEVRGIRVNEDVFWIHIRDGSGTVHTLQKSDLARVDRELEGTLMPSYASRLQPAEVDDLVAYLTTLRGAK